MRIGHNANCIYDWGILLASLSVVVPLTDQPTVEQMVGGPATVGAGVRGNRKKQEAGVVMLVI